MTTPANQPDLIAWLRARLDDDERVARAAERYWHGVRIESATTAEEDHALRHDPTRVLAEVDAKRRILDLVTDSGPEWGDGYTEAYRDVARVLALPYAGRPDYRDEWRPA